MHNQTHRKSVRERLSIYTAKYSCGGGGKCRQTDSIGSDGDGLPWNETIGLPHVSSRETGNIQQGLVEEGMENVGKRTPSDPMETGCRGKSPSDCRVSVRERLSKYTVS